MRRLPIVLTGGPADGQWYWPDDFATRQLAARRMDATHHRTRLDPARWALLYAPTAKILTHHRDPQKQAVAWVWTGPAEARTLRDLARLHAEAEAHQPAAPHAVVAGGDAA